MSQHPIGATGFCSTCPGSRVCRQAERSEPLTWDGAGGRCAGGGRADPSRTAGSTAPALGRPTPPVTASCDPVLVSGQGQPRPSRLGPEWVEIGKAAQELGHQTWAHPTSSGRRWAFGCSCGWNEPLTETHKPPTRATKAEAIRSCVGHVKKVVLTQTGDAARNGVSVPRAVGGRL
jgi:hypothetical protein